MPRGLSIPPSKRELAGTASVRFNVGIFETLLATLTPSHDPLFEQLLLTAWDVSLQMFLPREALSAVRTENHLFGPVRLLATKLSTFGKISLVV